MKASDVSISAEQNKDSDYEPAIKIIRERTSNGKKDYYVLFANNEKNWADKSNASFAETVQTESRMISFQTKKETE